MFGEGQNFFSSSLLPELLGKWYTRLVVNSTNIDHRNENSASQSRENTAMANQSTIATTSSSQNLYCYCCSPKDRLMIACDNTECKIEWFHQDCVELISIPAGDWNCPDCCNLPQFLNLK